MAIIIKRSSRGDVAHDAILSRGDAVGAKFYHVVTKFYHYVTLQMIFRLREIHALFFLILSKSKSQALDTKSIFFPYKDKKLTGFLTPFYRLFINFSLCLYGFFALFLRFI
jgi:hypothetical protein